MQFIKQMRLVVALTGGAAWNFEINQGDRQNAVLPTQPEPEDKQVSTRTMDVPHGLKTRRSTLVLTVAY